MFKKNKKVQAMTREQALACRPIQNNVVSWEILDSGLIQIEYTLVLKPILSSIFKNFSRNSAATPTKKIQLDEMGSRVWQMIDGQKNTSDIIREFASVQKISNQESEQSITAFLRELGKRGLVGLH